MGWVKIFLAKAWPPLILLAATLMIDAFATFGLIPNSADLFNKFVELASSASLFVIMLLALLEHTVFVGVYFPAAVVILIVMGNTYGNLSAAILVFCAILIGQVGGYSLSYMMGRFMKAGNTKEYGVATKFAIFMTFIHPHAGAISSFLIGTRNIGWKSFAATLFVALGIWSTFWATISYFGVFVIVSEIGWDIVFYSYMAAWLCLIAWRVGAQERPK